MSPRGHLRAADRDRDEVAERLRVAATEGRLGPDELDERLARALSATTYGELDTLIEDLPVPVAPPPPPRIARAGFGRRLGAWLLDGIIVGLVLGVLGHIFHGIGFGVGLLVWLAYFVALEGGPVAAGLGKRLVGIRVVDARTGGRLGYGRALVRTIGRFVSAIPLYLGYFWMLSERDRRCWHDMMAGDVVVFADGRTEPDLLPRPY